MSAAADATVAAPPPTPPAPGPAAAGLRATWLAAPLVALVAIAFWPALRWLVVRWFAADGYFSHGPAIPIASAWMVWHARARLRATRAAGSWWGLAWIVPALAIGAAAARLRIDSPAALALFALLPGFVLLFAGVARLRALAVPLAFLLFAWPLPMFVVVRTIDFLKRIVVPSSCALVNLFGADVRAHGSFLLLPGGGRLLVDDECSGLKSALALVALGAFMAATARELSVRRRVVLIALALPVALVANIVRVALLAAIGRGGGAATAGRWHDASNWAVYLVAIAIYVGLERVLRTRRRTGLPPALAPETGSRASEAGSTVPATLSGRSNRARYAVALLLTGAAAVVRWKTTRPPPATSSVHLLVARDFGGWHGEDRPLTPRQYDLLETRDVLFREYVRGGAKGGRDGVLACVAIAGVEGKAAHPPEICYRGQGWQVLDQRRLTVALAARERVIDRLRLRQEKTELLVWSWYRVGDEETPDWLREQQLALGAAIAGRDERAMLLRFSIVLERAATPDPSVAAASEAAAETRLHEFVENFLPAFDAALAADAAAGLK